MNTATLRVIALAATGFVLSCSGPEKEKPVGECTTNGDCGSEESCVDGACVPISAEDSGTADTGIATDSGDVGSTDTGDGPFCEEGASRITIDMCGLNQRGTFNESCEGGVWVLVGDCSDPDVCVDDAEQQGSTACGLNDRGTLGRRGCSRGDLRSARSVRAVATLAARAPL